MRLHNCWPFRRNLIRYPDGSFVLFDPLGWEIWQGVLLYEPVIQAYLRMRAGSATVMAVSSFRDLG